MIASFATAMVPDAMPAAAVTVPTEAAIDVVAPTATSAAPAVSAQAAATATTTVTAITLLTIVSHGQVPSESSKRTGSLQQYAKRF